MNRMHCILLVMFVTGYIGDPTFLKQTVEVAISLKAVNPNLVYGKDINVINICLVWMLI